MDDEINLRQTTIVEQVMEKIKEYIADGKYKPGDRIPTEGELAARFGVGRSSIREAIKIFSYLGIFDSQRRNGTFLNPQSSISREVLTWTFLLGPKDFAELFDLRKAVEQEAWMVLFQKKKADPESVQSLIEKLNRQLDVLDNEIAIRDLTEMTHADYAFHQMVVNESGNSQLAALFDVLGSFTMEEIKRSNIHRENLGNISDEHRSILQALDDETPVRMIDTFRSHIEGTKKRVLEARKKEISVHS